MPGGEAYFKILSTIRRMSPHALDPSSSRKRSDPLGDEVGDVVHVKSHPRSKSTQKYSTATIGKRVASLEANHKIATRSTKQQKSTLASTMSAILKEGNPIPRVSRAKKGKRVHGCTQPGCDKVASDLPTCWICMVVDHNLDFHQS